MPNIRRYSRRMETFAKKIVTGKTMPAADISWGMLVRKVRREYQCLPVCSYHQRSIPQEYPTGAVRSQHRLLYIQIRGVSCDSLSATLTFDRHDHLSYRSRLCFPVDSANYSARKVGKPTAAMIQVSKDLSLSRELSPQKWNENTYSHSIPRYWSISGGQKHECRPWRASEK